SGGQLTQRGKLLCLNQTVLGGAQIVERFGKLARAGLNAFEQTHIFNCNCGLVSERRGQFHLLFGEWADFRTTQSQNTDLNVLAQHWNGEDGAVITQLLMVKEGVFRISLYVGNMNHPTFKQCATECGPSFRFDRSIFDMIHELTREAVSLCTV